MEWGKAFWSDQMSNVFGKIARLFGSGSSFGKRRSIDIHFRPDALACPNCSKQSLEVDREKLSCNRCGGMYPIWDGIPILLTDPQAKTQLEDTDYDAIHEVDSTAHEFMYKGWSEVFSMCQMKHDNLLEIGSGTGLLTYGLVSNSIFKNIHTSDISYKFIRILMEKMPESSSSQYFYVCDANHLPFKRDLFDAIVGNSVLHHFLDYPVTLAKCFEMLRKDGVAIFTEPVREGHVILSFFSALLREMHLHTDLKVFNPEELEILDRVCMRVTKHLRLKDDRERIARMEDKYIFSIKEMRALGKEIGYRNTRYINMADKVAVPPSRGYKSQFMSAMKRQGIPLDKIERFDFIFSCFGKTFSDAFGEQLVTPFGFFVFEK
jgi:ubiquinone/menaquinone biosynthesis C-methylase UbiE/uncharacterized protein YbaR (Trm112 family)